MTDSISSGPGLFHLTWCPTGSSMLLQMTDFYSSHGRMVVHRVCTSHFPYPPLGWWSLLLLLHLGHWSNVAASMAMRMSFDTPMSHPWAVHLWVWWMPLMVVFYFSRNVHTAFCDGFTNSAGVCKLSPSIFAVGSGFCPFDGYRPYWGDMIPQYHALLSLDD